MAFRTRRCWLRAILLTLSVLGSNVVASASSQQFRYRADPSAAFLSRKCSHNPFSRPALWTTYHHRDQSGLSVAQRIATLPRGGSSVGEEDADSDDEYDEYDQYDDEESEDASIDSDAVQIEVKVEKFDEPLVASPMANLYAGFAILLLSRKIDLFHPTVVKIARFAFIAYLAVLQLFLLYVRIQAKLNNDRTPIELKNPLSSVLGGGDGDDNNNNMMKNLASSLLSSTSTVLEYDLKQARSMQSGLILNMLFVWFLHFKMEQVQPLLIQTLNGLTSMVYSPLFQVYVLGRNLERPFQNPNLKRMQDAAAAAQQEQLEEENDAETAETVVDNDEDEKDEDESEAEISVEDEDESEAEESEADEDAESEQADSEKGEDDEEEAGGDNEEESGEEANYTDDAAEKPESASVAEENDAGENEAEDKASADEGAKTEE